MNKYWPISTRQVYVILILFFSSGQLFSQPENTIEIVKDVNFLSQQKLIERATLIEIYQASPANTLGKEWLELMSDSNFEVCQLPGVTCNSEGYITMLELMQKGLFVLPASLPNLTSLEVLDLYGNQLTALPESIASMWQLQKIYISNNQLIIIPEDIRGLRHLTLFFVF